MSPQQPRSAADDGASNSMNTAVPHSAVAERASTHASRRPRQRLVLTDDQLRLSVQERLSQFGSRVARTVRVDVRHGEVVLRGAVGTDYERRLIEQTVGRLSGIEQLDNRLRIHAADSAGYSTDNAGFTLPAFVRTLAWASGTLIGITAVLWVLWQIVPQSHGRDAVPASHAMQASAVPDSVCLERGDFGSCPGFCRTA